MFTLQDRQRVRDHVLGLAQEDDRVVAAAIVGSLASGGSGDRYSDIDLTFAISDDASMTDVLDGWQQDLADNFDAVPLMDLERDPILYRVFLLPRALQLDVSVSPASRFRATSERFDLIFGTSAGPAEGSAPPQYLLGWALIWARHTRVTLERGRSRQAHHAVTHFRDYALSLACERRGLPSSFGRGLEQLPPQAHESFANTIARSHEPEEIRRALEATIAALLKDSEEFGDLAPGLEDLVRDLLD